MSRDIRVDTLRGLACLLLVAYHVAGSRTTGLTLGEDHWLAQFNLALSYLRMPLFCFLSGYVYAWRPYNGQAGRYLTGKVRRLLVPMLLVGTLFALLQALTPGTNLRTGDWRLLHIVPVAHYWFLESLFFIFMATAVLEHLRLLDTPLRFSLVWLLSAIFFLVNPLTELLGLVGAGYLLPFFLLGVGCNRFDYKLGGRAVWVLLAGLAGFCVYVAYAGALPDKGGLASLLVGSAACVVLLRSGFQSRWLAAIGVYSFGIYLFHTMFAAATRIVLTRMGVDSMALQFTLGAAAGILGAIATVEILRRLPLGHWVLGESAATSKKQKSRFIGGASARRTAGLG